MQNPRAKISCIGGGSMGAALLGGLLRAGWSAESLAVSEPDDARRGELARRFGVDCMRDNAECAARGEVLVFAVKPQFMRDAVTSVAEEVRRNNALLISFAAGIRCKNLQRWCGGAAVVRAMPNTPALVGAGVSGMFAAQKVSDAQRALAEQILRALGEVVWVGEEHLLDIITAVSGSGPAYFFKVMEILAERAQGHGVDAGAAVTLALHTAIGAAELARSGRAPAALRRDVTSPGGVTEEALAKMREHGFERSLCRGIDAAQKHAAKLADEFGRA